MRRCRNLLCRPRAMSDPCLAVLLRCVVFTLRQSRYATRQSESERTYRTRRRAVADRRTKRSRIDRRGVRRSVEHTRVGLCVFDVERSTPPIPGRCANQTSLSTTLAYELIAPAGADWQFRRFNWSYRSPIKDGLTRLRYPALRLSGKGTGLALPGPAVPSSYFLDPSTCEHQTVTYLVSDSGVCIPLTSNGFLD